MRPVVAVGLVLAIALTGCAGRSTVQAPETSTPAVTETPTPSATPFATPTNAAPPAPADDPQRPRPSIDLDCANLVDAVDLSTFMGVDVEQHDPLESYILGGWGAGNAVTVAAGGLECEWSNGAPNNGNTAMQDGYAGMVASILPGGTALWLGDSLGYTWRESVGCVGNEGSQCSVSKLVGTTILEIHVEGIDRMGRTPEERLAGFMPILESLEASILVAGNAPELPVPADWMWGGCDKFVPMSQLSEITGLAVEEGFGDGGGGWSVAGLASTQLDHDNCIVATDDSQYLFTMSSTEKLGWFVTDYSNTPSPQGPAVHLDLAGLAAGDSAWSRCARGDNVTVFTRNNCIVDLVIDGDWVEVRMFDSTDVDFGRPALDVLTDVAAAIAQSRT